MGASEFHHPEPTAPPAVGQALCVECKEAAAQRCDDCFDEEEGPLYLCAKEACFDAQHGERQRRQHRTSLVAWDSKAKCTNKCCATHKGNVLALWCVDCSTVVCALCCMHGGVHTGHKTSLVTDAWKGIQEQLQATMGQLEDENAKNRERLQQLQEEQDGLASGNGAVGDARRALEEVKARFLAKVAALSGELDKVAARWSAQVAAEYERLARHTRCVQALVDGMRATCAEEKAEEAQRVTIAHTELCAQRDALGSAPPEAVRVLEFDADPLRQAVAQLRVAARLCSACRMCVPEYADLCIDCAGAVSLFQAGGGNLKTASESLQSKKAVVLAAVAQDAQSLQYASSELRADKDVVLAAVAQEGSSLYHAGRELKADKDVVIAAVAQYSLSLYHASEELKADKDVVLAACLQDGHAIQYSSTALKADKDVIRTAVTQNGPALLWAHEGLKSDKSIVLAAVARSGYSLKFASSELRADKDVVLAAVAQDGRSLRFASKELRADKKVMRAAGL